MAHDANGADDAVDAGRHAGHGRRPRNGNGPNRTGTRRRGRHQAGTRERTVGRATVRRTPPARPCASPTCSFDQAIDIADVVAQRRRLRRSLLGMRLVALLLLTASLVIGGLPVALQYRSSLALASTSASVARHVAGWPYTRVESALASARDYNRRLAASGQPVLGEVADPFASAQGGSHASGEDPASSLDEDYRSQLDGGDGVMGTIRVPGVSIELPIYHGTSEAALAAGAGHLYGTSLPVGGESTHAVITGHRGLVEAMMFTRLDEVKEGDFFYIEVMGETLGYQVDRISVIEPDDVGGLRVVPGEDRVTLMTCTPYGVNTHRLLVSGRRVAVPDTAPEPDTLRDGRMTGILAAVGLLAGGWGAAALSARLRRRPWRAMRHAARRPR